MPRNELIDFLFLPFKGLNRIFTFLLTCMNFSEAKILAVPGYMGDIRGSDFPVRLMISFLSIVRRRVQAERGAWKERTRDAIPGHSGIITTN